MREKILGAAGKTAEKKKLLEGKKYPPEVISAATFGKLCTNGIDLRIAAEDCAFIRSLDAQRRCGKGVYGAGFLLSERAAAERAAAEKKVEKILETWELSQREKEIVKELGKREQ